MKKNITLDSVISRHNKNKNDLIETLATLVKKQGGFIELYNCEIETKEEMKIDTLVCTNDVIFITYIDNDNYEVVCSTDDFTYDEIYEMLRSLCIQLNL